MDLLERLEYCDELVRQILVKPAQTPDADELRKTRAMLGAAAIAITDYMEVYVDFLAMDEADQEEIFRVPSYIEFRLTLPQLQAADVNRLLDDYVEVSQKARQICLRNMERI